MMRCVKKEIDDVKRRRYERMISLLRSWIVIRNTWKELFDDIRKYELKWKRKLEKDEADRE
jgi:hypothetical protein